MSFTKKKKVNQPNLTMLTKHVTNFNIEWVDINSVRLWVNNPRKNEEASEDLIKTIQAHGLRSPLVVWKNNMVIYKGNTTWKTCKKAGYSKVPVIFHEFKSEAAAVAYGIADNASSEKSEWDYDVLYELMGMPEIIALEDTLGFSEKEMKNFKFETNIDIKDYNQTTGRKNLVVKIKCPVDHAEALKELVEEVIEEHFPDDIKKFEII